MLTSCSSREAVQEKPLQDTPVQESESVQEQKEAEETVEQSEDLQPQFQTDLKPEEEEGEPQSDSPIQKSEEEKAEKDDSEEAKWKGKDGKYSQYNWLIDPLEPFELLTEDFSAQNPPDFGNGRWYDLVIHSEERTELTDGEEEPLSFPADTVENIITEHFEVTVEQIRAENEDYSQQENSYQKNKSSSQNTAECFGISGAKEQDGVFALVVDLYNEEDKIFNTSILTIQMVEEEGKETSWKYLSNQVLFQLTKE